MRFLIVDDDATLRAIVRSKLCNLGHAVVEAADGCSGWAAMQDAAIDCALVDLGLPDMDGRELIERARAIQATRRLPIIVITGRHDRDAIDAAFKTGADYFLTKPINWPLFPHQLGYVLRMATSERQARRAQVATRAESHLKDTVIGRLDHVLQPLARQIASNAQQLAFLASTIAGAEQFSQHVERIRADAADLVETLGTMANFATLLTESVNISQRRVPLAALLDGAMEALQARYAEAPVVLETPQHELWIDCDQEQLTRALVGLLDNAFRFSPADRSVTLSAQHFEDGGVCLRVDDDGAGIPAPRLCQLLTPLSPVDQPAAGHHSSDGLGLAVAKFIAEAHGGKLTIQSAIGNGTTASIYLPADLISLADQDAEAA